MSPTDNGTITIGAAAAASGGFQNWNSPIPFLFGGIAVLMGLAGVVLMILACSFKKSSSDPESQTEEVKSTKPTGPFTTPETEPRIVVIMAGDDNPSYLAKPVVSDRNIDQV